MSQERKEKLAEKLSSVKFNEESKGLRQKISVFILIIIILGYLFLVLFNVVVGTSAYGIRAEGKNFDRAAATNETFGIEGTIIIKNDHWNSLDIDDLVIQMRILTEDGDEIKEKRKVVDKIHRLQNTEIDLDFTFSIADVTPENYLDSYETFISLSESESFIIELSISVRYTIYVVNLEIEIETDVE